MIEKKGGVCEECLISLQKGYPNVDIDVEGGGICQLTGCKVHMEMVLREMVIEP